MISLSCSTDNQGNSYLLDRMMTTRYPLGVILMELAHQMKRRHVLLRARWLPRSQNQEADDLTNYEYRHFDPAKRIHIEFADLNLSLMDSLFRAGDEYEAELARARARAKAAKQAGLEGKLSALGGRKRGTLKESDPWL